VQVHTCRPGGIFYGGQRAGRRLRRQNVKLSKEEQGAEGKLAKELSPRFRTELLV
jgi:hypothetical protein